jgi:hypothetical protein
VKEVKVLLIFREKSIKPLAGMVRRWESLSDVSRDLEKKIIEVATLMTTEMEGSEVGESSDEIESLLGCLIIVVGFDSERE